MTSQYSYFDPSRSMRIGGPKSLAEWPWVHSMGLFTCHQNGDTSNPLMLRSFYLLCYHLHKLLIGWQVFKNIYLYNTKPAQSLCSAFSRNSQSKNRSETKVTSPEASVLPGQNCLCYHFIIYPTNKSCSQGCSRSLINGHFKNVVAWALANTHNTNRETTASAVSSNAIISC